MSSARRKIRVLAALLPLGVAGISAALAAAPGKPVAIATEKGESLPGVAARLQAIRDAVSQVAIEDPGLQAADPDIQQAWWGNGGWGNGGWRNGGWRNWNNGWRNWGNGWGNGGWRNFWRNW
jgi:rSAM-associated Gly-rich repeat protein